MKSRSLGCTLSGLGCGLPGLTLIGLWWSPGLNSGCPGFGLCLSGLAAGGLPEGRPTVAVGPFPAGFLSEGFISGFGLLLSGLATVPVFPDGLPEDTFPDGRLP